MILILALRYLNSRLHAELFFRVHAFIGSENRVVDKSVKNAQSRTVQLHSFRSELAFYWSSCQVINYCTRPYGINKRDGMYSQEWARYHLPRVRRMHDDEGAGQVSAGTQPLKDNAPFRAIRRHGQATCYLLSVIYILESGMYPTRRGFIPRESCLSNIFDVTERRHHISKHELPAFCSVFLWHSYPHQTEYLVKNGSIDTRAAADIKQLVLNEICTWGNDSKPICVSIMPSIIGISRRSLTPNRFGKISYAHLNKVFRHSSF